ncbi:MAG: hypothetical protein AAF726_02105 [Planctomycetota bacterium]
MSIDHLTTKCYGKGLVTKLPHEPAVISKKRAGESLKQLVERHEKKLRKLLHQH